MTRAPRLLQRCGAALFGVAFLFAVQATAAGWRSCPHHDQVAAAHAAPAVEHGDHSAGAPSTPQHEDGPCSCLSGAQCAVPVAIPGTSTLPRVAAMSITRAAAQPLAHQVPARLPSLYLPDATAPPAVL